MSKQKIQDLTRDSEAKRTDHWWQSKRGPAFIDPFIHFDEKSIEIVKPLINRGQIVVDLGCGWGYYAFKLADLVGPYGKVYCVDLSEKCTQKIISRIQKRKFDHIEVHNSTAADINFIPDSLVDLVFANGLLCSMAIERDLAVSEIKRVLKATGYAYLSLGAVPPMGYVDEEEWHGILQGFNLVEGGNFKEKWALVSLS